ncbi:MAG TPA: MDR family MFS transporter [Stellaceae bacterium]|nr:MDR family MFS transporter [Stellaceae bacterium]
MAARPQPKAAGDTTEFTQPEILSIISGLMLAMFLAGLDQTIVATSLSTMARDLQGWQLMSWVVSGYLIASTTVTPIYGRLSDLYGRRPILLTSIGLFVGASVLCALSQTMPELIAARVLQGIGGGGLRSVSQAVIADVVAPRERGRYQGYFSSMFAISSILGPILGGLFADDLTWHWIFWINVPLGLAAFALSNRTLKRLRLPDKKPVIDWLGALLILLATTPLLIGVGNVEQVSDLISAGVIGPLVIGLVFVVGLILRERVAPEPMLPLRLFGNSIFSCACILSLSMSMVMIGLTILVPLNYELVGGLAPDLAGARLIPMTGGTVAGSFLAGQLLTRTGRYRIFPIIGTSVMTLACLAIAYVGLGHSLGFDIVATGILGASFGFQLAPIIVPVQNALAARDTGIGLSCVMFFRLIGGAFGVSLLSTVLVAGLNTAASAVPGHELLGPLPGLALFHLDQASGHLTPQLVDALARALPPAFSRIFLVAALVSLPAVVAALCIKEIPLRGRETEAAALAE